MWNKQRSDEPLPARRPGEPTRYAPPAQPVSTALPAQPIAQRVEPAPAPRPATAVIGASMTIKGNIHAREELIVDGDVEGALESQSLITVGPNGKVRANIKAREVVIFGSVRGNVDVSEKIAIREQGSLVGDIKAAGISIDDGAYFKGNIDIVRPEPKAAAKPVKAEPQMEAVAG